MLALWLLLSLAGAASAWNTLSLDTAGQNAKWTVENRNRSIQIPATVPGGIYSDLQDSNIIEDILLDYNDVNTRWVAYDAWTYTGVFNVTADLLQHEIHHLVFYGLDTISYIALNNAPIGSSNNMFVTNRFDVKSHLKEGENSVEVVFKSPVDEANILSSNNFTAPDCVPKEYHGECHVNQLRKMQASFGWDWGPAFPSVGIWRNVAIEFFNRIKILSISTNIKNSDDTWIIKLTVHFEADKRVHQIKGNLEAALLISSTNTIKVATSAHISIKQDGTGEKEIILTVDQDEVELWWPNGYGEQNLYKLAVHFDTNYNESSTHFVEIGFRTIELVEHEAWTILGNDSIGGTGLTFYFKVNGYPLFMKGSNMIPTHILPEQGNDKDYVDELLYAAKEAHMSMLRVWGGGVYESDYFYSACDRLGILIWQDLMFACAMYPVTPEFITSVRREIKQNVIRLQYHPSIALWAGNNENEAALVGDWYSTSNDADRYKEEYIELYVDVIKPIVESLDPTRRYLVSSPSNGKYSEANNYIDQNPYDGQYGDTHFYNYNADAWDTMTFPKTRFASEYGFQSSPSLSTLSSATRSKALFEVDDQFLEHRQHSPNGNSYIMQQIQTHFDLDFHDPNYKDKFVFYSQIVQAMAMKVESEFYRQSQEEWFTMGALYWQLNDLWQAPTWSGIEYGGNWKMLHYYAKWFFSPVLLSTSAPVPGLGVSAFLLNDRFTPIEYGEIIVEYFNWNSLTPLRSEKFHGSVGPLSAKKLNVTLNFYDDYSMYEVFLRFSLKAVGVEWSPYNYVFPASFKDIIGLKIPTITISVEEETGFLDGRYTYNLKVTVDTVVLFLWLEASYPGHFSDNGLILAQAETKIQFFSKVMIKNFALEKSITYKSYLH